MFTDRRLALGLLFLAALFNYLDRQLLSILIEPIKTEFSLSDTSVGLLTGPAFALFYVTLGIPLARIADRGHRLSLLSISLALWSVMTAVCGLAGSYWQLLLARIGVGIGEAGGTPPAHAYIADVFPEAQRGRALSVYSFGVPAGIFCGFLLGGSIGEALGWRAAFLSLGVPGVLLAAAIAFFVREPTRRTLRARPAPLREVLGRLWSIRSFRWQLLASGLVAIAGYGAVQWSAPFLMRSHGLSLTEAGLTLAVLVAVFSSLGVIFGGVAGDRLADRLGKAWYAWFAAILSLAACPIALGAFLAPDFVWAVALLAALNLLMNAITAPLFAGAYAVVPSTMRATASAALLFAINLLGLGVGPLAVGIVSDALRSAVGADSLSYSLSVLVLGYAVAAVAFGLAALGLARETGTAPGAVRT